MSLLVKICGTRNAEVADEAIKAGADFIGMILVPGRSRSVTPDDAMAISRVVHGYRPLPELCTQNNIWNSYEEGQDYFANSCLYITRKYPLLVGVFQDQPLCDVIELQKLYKIDIVQLHGSEFLLWAKIIPAPVFRSFSPGQTGIGRRGYHILPLLDSATGGSGKRLDMGAVKSVLANDLSLRIILAGGLNPDNVVGVIQEAAEFGERIVGVDVSSGIEENGVQSIEKIRAFIKAAKSVR